MSTQICCPADAEDVGDGASQLEVHLCCNVLAAEDVLLLGLNLCCASCTVEHRCCSTSSSIHHVDGVRLEHVDKGLVEVGGDGVQFAQLVPCTAHCVGSTQVGGLHRAKLGD